MKRIVLSLLFALVGVPISALVIHQVLLARTQSTTTTPFTAFAVKKLFNGAGRQTNEVTLIHASKADGNTVDWKTTIDGQRKDIRTVMDWVGGQKVIVDPVTRSRVTYFLSDDVVRAYHHIKTDCVPRTKDNNIDATPHATNILGYDTTHITVHAKHVTFEQWVAPALGCYELQKITSTDDHRKTVTTVSQIVEGPPDQSWFLIPSDFKERRPSELLQEAARVRGKDPSSVKADRLDTVYNRSRRTGVTRRLTEYYRTLLVSRNEHGY